MDSFWTADREQRLATLWAEGNSAALIADLLGAPSRNSVIGKVNRLRLARSAEEAPARRPKEPRPKAPRAMPTNSPVRAAVSRRKVEVKLAGRAGAGEARVVEEASPEPAPEPERPVGPVTIENLRPGVCHFPLWSDRERSGPYCGAVTVSETSSWCCEHWQRVRAPVQPGRAR